MNPSQRLRRARMLRVEIHEDSVMILVNGSTVTGSKHVLRILDVFAQPISIKDAVDVLKPLLKGMQDWIDLTGEIATLREKGVLVEANHDYQDVSIHHGFGRLPVHISMIRDVDRTQAFMRAIRETVVHGDVVLEIGTGLGLLAIAAVKAGARHVYAIETTGISSLAEEMFIRNGVNDKITLIRGWSTQIDLPERADVLIAELIGNNTFEEYVLESTRDAVQRHLKPDAKLIPESIDLMAQLVYVPDDVLERYSPTAAQNTLWQDMYDIDFAPLLDSRHKRALRFAKAPYECRDWMRTPKPVKLQTIDLRNLTEFYVDSSVTDRMNEAFTVNGVIVYPNLRLSQNVYLSRDLDQVKPENNWRNVVEVLPASVTLSYDESFTIKYQTGLQHTQVQLTLGS